MHNLLDHFSRATDTLADLGLRHGRVPLSAIQWYSRTCMFWTLLLIGLVGIPALHASGAVSIETVNQLGRYLCFAIAALSLDLVWGYGGMLCLCQFLFFSLGGYAMGMFCAHHGGPEGVIDAVNWGKIPACLFVVYPGGVGESQDQWTVPFFWKPFWNIWTTLILGIVIPGVVAAVIGFFVFRSRVRGVFFAVLTQAIVLAFWLVVCMNNMKLGGTNGLTRFDRIILDSRENISITIAPQKLAEANLEAAAVREAVEKKAMEISQAYIEQVEKKRQLLTRNFASPPAVNVDAVPIEVRGSNSAMMIRLARSIHVWKVLAVFEELTVAEQQRLSDIAEVKIAGYDLNNKNVKLALYLLTVIVLVAVFLLCQLLMKSRIGRVLIAVRDNESRLRFSGYRPYVFKMLVFGISGAIAGLGGMLYAPQMKIFTPTNLEPKESIAVVIFVAVGGRATLSGPIFGALVVSYLYSLLTSHSPDAWPIVLGLLFILVTLYLPGGLMGIWQSWVSLAISQKTVRSSTGVINSTEAQQDRIDVRLAVVGILAVTFGFSAAWGLGEYARPWDDGLMAQRNGSSVVVGLILMLTAVSALLQVLAGLGLITGRVWGSMILKRTLPISIGLSVTAVGWLFFVGTLRSGIADWGTTGFTRVSELVSTVPHLPVLTLWSAAALFYFHRFLSRQAVRTTVAADAAEDQTDEALPDASAVQDRASQLARIVAKQKIGPSKSTLDNSLLEVRGVKVVFDGFKALDVAEFSAGYYDLNVIIGPNGAGKTTLCDVISGKTPVTEGQVHLGGHQITGLTEADIARLGVGRKFQTPTVFDSLTVYGNMELAIPGRHRLVNNVGIRPSAAERLKIEEILARVKLLEHAEKDVRHLSHGQRQWLEISMLILSDPRLLLVDEPAAGLTDEETILTAELLLELKAEHSVIVIEHDMEFVRLLNSSVTVLNEGSVMAQGEMQAIEKDPAVIEAYLGR
ncbi:MAG: urea ABC transporter ATP-binding protein UrtD [Fuerstiella sp.]|nr:urea ABC transporter ATP-binding protein UrtD [Fuerstiella sp.]